MNYIIFYWTLRNFLKKYFLFSDFLIFIEFSTKKGRKTEKFEKHHTICSTQLNWIAKYENNDFQFDYRYSFQPKNTFKKIEK